MSDIIVSVFCATYNHELYIGKAIEGFLMQKTNFKFEVFVFDDKSTDGTAKVLKRYEENFPEVLNVIYHSENLFSQKIDFFRTEFLSMYKGKYIAFCEGDDYWTDPLKLQNQVDFLESNLEYSFCFHDSVILNQSTGASHFRIGKRKIDDMVDLNSVIVENNIPTASLVFRNCINWSNLPNWFVKTRKGDYALVILLAEKGLGKYIASAMSVYRVHEGGVWSGKAESDYHVLENINFFKELLFYFTNNLTKAVIRVRLRREYVNHSLLKIRQGNIFRGLLIYAANGGVGASQLKKQKIRKLLGAIRTGVVYKMKQVRFGQP